MSAFLRIILSVLILTAVSCGSVQTKSDAKAGGNGDVNDEFFQDDTPLLSRKKSSETGVVSKPASATAENPENINTVSDIEKGYAAWYGKELQGKPTVSGEIFDMNKFTAAHRTYPMGSLVLVRNLENGKKKLVKINDRGPYVDGRIVDVSYAVAKELDFATKGVAQVEVELIEKGHDDFIAKKTGKVSADVPDESVPVDLDEEIEKLTDSDADDYFFADGLRPKNFTVRTGAFKILKNAEKYREDLEDKYNLNAFLGKKGKFHFVWIGDFDTKESAKKFYKKLKTDGLDVLNPKKVQ